MNLNIEILGVVTEWSENKKYEIATVTAILLTRSQVYIQSPAIVLERHQGIKPCLLVWKTSA